MKMDLKVQLSFSGFSNSPITDNKRENECVRQRIFPHFLYHYVTLKLVDNKWSSSLSPSSQCLKITLEVSFNILSEASYVYIWCGQKFIWKCQKWPIFAPKFIWDILADFQTLCIVRLLHLVTEISSIESKWTD